ncbi:MAG: magnesium chelatase subunit H [Desulfobacterota bacterium]|nr:magnesium chelatase subunit H [Thermodesulfobacteriota bacterium]
MKLCIIAVGASSITATQQVLRSWESGPWAGRCTLAAHYVGSDAFSEDAWPRIFHNIYTSDFVLLDTMGVPQAFSDALAEGLAGYAGHVAVVNATSLSVRALTRLGSFSLGMMRRKKKKARSNTSDDPLDAGRMMRIVDWMERIGRTLPIGPLRDMRNFFWISRYWLYGSVDNIENMLYLIGREYYNYSDFPEPRPPVLFQDCSIMDPESGSVYTTLTEYEARICPIPEKPRIGLLFRTKSYPLDTHPVVCAMQRQLAQAFCVIPIGLDSIIARDFEKLRELLMPGGTQRVDLLINTEPFRLGQGPIGGDAAQGIQFLETLNVPVLHPFFLHKRTVQQWQEDDKGVDAGEFLISVFLPELDGCIETYPVAAVGTPEDEVPELTPLADRITHLLNRCRNWYRLRITPNHEKKIALIIYDYPPGAAGVGTAAFLDTFASLAALLQKLADAGYMMRPMTPEEIKQSLIACSTGHTLQNIAPLLVDRKLYRTLTNGIPGFGRVEQSWGPFPGTNPETCNAILIPGIINGNVFIGMQPPRTPHIEQHRQTYHDKYLPPHHQYIAFYRWIERVFQAHAIVHVGTHGTLEFLPGKEKGMSGSCFPDILTGHLPHIYLYYCGNPSEAVIAKRRSHAVTIGHLPPPMKQGELYAELHEIELLLREHDEARNLNPGRCQTIAADIKERIKALGWEWHGIDELHRRLHDIKTALIPARLHILGNGFTDEEIADYLTAYFRTSGENGHRLYRACASSEGFDWETIARDPHLHTQAYEKTTAAVGHWIKHYILNNTTDTAPPAFEQLIAQGKKIARLLKANRELEELLRALNGEFILPGVGGDLFRSPDILPSGRNLVQFDPRLIPSPSALKHGARIAEATLIRYRDKHNTYPRSIAVVLWGLETAQTYGETVGQILAYLGVRVVKKTGNWETIVELVPLEELGRPRIDVTVQICGFFRDMFPTTLAMLHNAFSCAAFADEPDSHNFVRAHARTVFETLQQQGIEAGEARELSLARVFGPAAAEYGTSLERLVKERVWQHEADLIAAYLQSLQHVYTPRHYGIPMKSLLSENLSRVDVVSQVRSSRDYEITDLDHYYEFFGGLSKSVEQASGKKALMFISDTHEGVVRTEDIKDAIRRGIYSRLTNPVWLDGMLRHSHHGGQEIARRMENLIGLAATTGAVDQAMFNQVSSRLVLDDTIRQRIRDNNPYALLDIIQRLWEAHTRGYWMPDAKTLDRLKQLYMDAESHAEGVRP